MRRFRFLVILPTIVVGFSSSASVATERSDADWIPVARSKIILAGTLHVPRQELIERKAEGKTVTVKLNVDVAEVLKGTTNGKSLPIAYFVNSEAYTVPADRLLKSDGQKVLLLLNPNGLGGYAFSVKNAVWPASPEMRRRFQYEIADQKRILQNFDKDWPPEKVANYAKVKGLVDQLCNRKDLPAAFERLQTLGAEAVPAMILLLNDNRPVPIKAVGVYQEGPNAFERIGWGSPGNDVYHVLVCILGLVTGDGFGGTQTEVINGWRIYLTHFATLKPALRAKQGKHPRARGFAQVN